MYSQLVTNGSLGAWGEVPGLSNNLTNDLDQDIDGMFIKFANHIKLVTPINTGEQLSFQKDLEAT